MAAQFLLLRYWAHSCVVIWLLWWLLVPFLNLIKLIGFDYEPTVPFDKFNFVFEKNEFTWQFVYFYFDFVFECFESPNQLFNWRIEANYQFHKFFLLGFSFVPAVVMGLFGASAGSGFNNLCERSRRNLLNVHLVSYNFNWGLFIYLLSWLSLNWFFLLLLVLTIVVIVVGGCETIHRSTSLW